MLRFFNIKYDILVERKANDLFSLRKKTFKDRLDWMVECKNDMEFDCYDNENATYILGERDNNVFCGLRFIETIYPNMIINTFQKYFENISLPKGNYIEASRLFIDKARVHTLGLKTFPVSLFLFISMINYADSHHYQGIYAVVSHPMLIIFQRSGWEISIIKEGKSEKSKKIFLIYMPVDSHNRKILSNRIKNKTDKLTFEPNTWPLSLDLWQNRSN